MLLLLLLYMIDCVCIYLQNMTYVLLLLCSCFSILHTAVVQLLCIAADGRTPHAAAVPHGLLPLAKHI